MGTQIRKRKGTTDSRSITAEIKNAADSDIINLAINPVFEGVTYLQLGRAMIDFVNVTDTVDSTQG